MESKQTELQGTNALPVLNKQKTKLRRKLKIYWGSNYAGETHWGMYKKAEKEKKKKSHASGHYL